MESYQSLDINSWAIAARLISVSFVQKPVLLRGFFLPYCLVNVVNVPIVSLSLPRGGGFNDEERPVSVPSAQGHQPLYRRHC